MKGVLLSGDPKGYFREWGTNYPYVYTYYPKHLKTIYIFYSYTSIKIKYMSAQRATMSKEDMWRINTGIWGTRLHS
jgi:hypothetical protein